MIELEEESIYGQLSKDRKRMQKEDLAPAHWSTGSYQLFKEKYLYEAENPRQQYQRIARTMSLHMPDSEYWEAKFFDAMWKGWISPSTPILANAGTKRGLVVSCAGSYIGDSIDAIYKAKHETAMLTKMGFGTSSYLGDIRGRGTSISAGGKSVGTLPVITGKQADMTYVAQGTARRGSWAGYLPMSHKDFDEVCSYLVAEPDGNNIGWNIYDKDVKALEKRDPESLRRYKKMLRTKLITGKGYLFFPDKVNRRLKPWMIKHNLFVKASNLCNEITLFSDEEHTFTCVLSSLNLSMWHEWKDTDLVETAIVFLDCVCSEFLKTSKGIPGLDKARTFTEKGRALGLGALGLHTLFQSMNIPFESLEAQMLNSEIFSTIQERAEKATKWLGETLGEPEWCEGFGRRNTHLTAIAPTKSTALLMGGASEGINPDPGMVFKQSTPAGEIDRVNPHLLKIMKERGVYTEDIVSDIRKNYFGSVQNVDWLSDYEKQVWRTAFEMNQLTLVDMAIERGKNLCQWQSFNNFIFANEKESVVNAIHKKIFLSEDMLGSYYIYGSRGEATVDTSECLACQ